MEVTAKYNGGAISPAETKSNTYSEFLIWLFALCMPQMHSKRVHLKAADKSF